MTDLALGLSAYKRGSGALPEVKCINLFAEQTPTNKGGVALLGRPALVPWVDIDVGPIRAVFRRAGAFDGDFIAVSGTNVYRVNSAGTATLLDGGIGDPDTRVSIAASDTHVFFANGNNAYVSTGTDVLPIDFPDDAGVAWVEYLQGYFLFVRSDSETFYWLAPGDIDIDALNFISAERSPDGLRAMKVLGDEAWAFGEATIEIFVATGQADPAFQRVQGRVFDRGCLNANTIASMDNTLFWVGDDHIVYRGSGVPTRVSEHTIEEWLRGSTADDLRAWTFSFDGHTFYALTNGDDKSYVFDASTSGWCEFSSYQRGSWRAHLGAFNSSLIVAGDDELGRLWYLSDTVFLDDTAAIIAEATAGITVQGNTPPCHNVFFDSAKGLAGAGVTDHWVEMRQSDDAGNTWSGWERANLGAMGEYGTRSVWRRRGNMRSPGRIFSFRISSPARIRISGARMNETV